MGKRWKSIKNVFLDFWSNNIKRNYKEISYAIGTFIAVAVGQVITLVLIGATIQIVAIGIAIDTLITYLLMKFFGKTQNGNGKGLPETKELVKLLRRDPFFRKYANNKIADFYYKNGNGIKLKDEEDE
jgi:hypothetical protein